MALNFDNTEIAFASKTRKQLKRLHLLFRLLNNNALSNMGKSLTLWAFKWHLPIKNMVKNSIFEAFVGGESIDESQRVIKELAKYNIETILDYGVEAKNDEKILDEIASTLVRKIAYVKEDPNTNIASSKITALSSDYLLEKVSLGQGLNPQDEAAWERVIERVEMISKAAYDSGNSIYFDAEESWMQQAIDDLVMMMMRKYNKERPIVFNTIQLYRHDRLSYLKELYEHAKNEHYILAVKLVRGAYMEKERERAAEMNYASPIQPDKEATDRDYNLAIAFCLEHIDEIAMCVATHNEESNYLLEELIVKHNVNKDHKHIITSQLYGMGDHLTFNLAKEGYNASKYVPYGPVKELIPYLIRRAQENTSVDGQTSRELALIKKELIRRKGGS